MKTFYHILVNVLIGGFTNNFVWFALTFFTYLETKSVLATAYIAGIYLVAVALSGFWLGSIVDHHKKKTAMLLSSSITLIFFTLGFLFFSITPPSVFQTINQPQLWILVLLLMAGVLAGNIRNIALPTLVTILVPEEDHAKANGMSGTVMGIAFAITSVGSGLILGYGGMSTVLLVAIFFTLVTIIHLYFLPIPEKGIVHLNEEAEKHAKKLDIKGTIRIVQGVPGLLALILFATINNFLGGVFMSLMDAYGLSLVSVQNWGIMWGFLSCGFIVGGLIVAKRGLGENPVRTMFLANILMWIVASVFTLQSWILLLGAGMFIWITLSPFIEASEQTVIQKVVPHERQGRVFGFAQSVEQSASPLTAFLIGPIAQFIFIPFMTTGRGAELMGSWYGVGPSRGIALLFTVTGLIGLLITTLAMRSNSYKLISKQYLSK